MKRSSNASDTTVTVGQPIAAGLDDAEYGTYKPCAEAMVTGVLGRKAQLSKNVVFLLNQVMLAGWDFT